MHRIDFTPSAYRSTQIGPRVLEKAIYAILRGTGAALLLPWKLLRKAPRFGGRRWKAKVSWRLAAVQYASAAGVWMLVRHPVYAGVNLSSAICIMLLIYALASHRQGEIRSMVPAMRYGQCARRWKRAAFRPVMGVCDCGARPGRFCLRAEAR